MTSYCSDSQQTCDWEPYEGNKECCTKLIHSQRIPRGIKGMARDFEGVRTGRNKKGAEGSSNQGAWKHAPSDTVMFKFRVSCVISG